MTPEEVELLQSAGEAFLFNIGVLVTKSVLYGRQPLLVTVVLLYG